MQVSFRPQLQRGLTLVELIITLVVAGILLGIGVPSMRTMIQDNRLVAAANGLVLTLNYARSEAIKRFAVVSLCASDDGANCTATAWDQGWIVFLDADVAGQVDAGDIVLRVHEALDGNVTVTLTGPAYVEYQPSGMLMAACEDCAETAATQLSTKHSLAGGLWSLMPISDAIAGPPGGGGGGGPGGGPPGGGPGPPGTGPVPATFTVCDGSRTGERGRSVDIALTGRVRTTEVVCD